MLPERFVDGVHRHIAMCHGQGDVRTLFYGQTDLTHVSNRGLVSWQAAVFESHTRRGAQLHFFVGETDLTSGALGRSVPYEVPVAIAGLVVGHMAYVDANGSVSVVINNEQLR